MVQTGVRVTVEVIHGSGITIRVNGVTGEWVGWEGDTEIARSGSLDGLRTNLKRKLKTANVKVAIKATQVKGDILDRIILTGIDVRSGNVRYRDDLSGGARRSGGQPRQLRGYSETILRRLDAAGEKKWRRLRRAFNTARGELVEFQSAHEIRNAKVHVQAEIDRQSEPDDDGGRRT